MTSRHTPACAPLSKSVTRAALLVFSIFTAVLSTSLPAMAAHKQKTTPVPVPGACPANKPSRHFTVDISGNASFTGGIYEGPLCIDVAFDPALQGVGIEGVIGAQVKGPDPGSVFLGSSGGAGVITTKVDTDVEKRDSANAPSKTLPEVIRAIETQAKNIGGLLDTPKSKYSIALRQDNTAIDKLAAMNKALKTTNADSLEATLKNQYLALKPDLTKAIADPKDFNPTDTPSKEGDVYLDEIQQLETKLAHLPLEFLDGKAKPSVPQDCDKSMDTNWTDWMTICKDSYYTYVKQELDADLAEAQLYTSTSDMTTTLKKQSAIVQYWNTIFTGIGLTNISEADDKTALTGLYTHVEVPCDGLFNYSVPTVLNLVTLDYAPTLTGADPTEKAQPAFVTVNCSTRFTISGGVGFSTIEQKTFAIVPGSDGKGGTVNIFGTTSDSKVTPVAIAVSNVRLTEWKNHGVGLYGSLGIGGNLQTSASATYFLPGISFAFWRTIYLTVGAGVGSQSVLEGQYKVGDTVPSGVGTIGAVTGTSHTAGFAFAVTFSKP